ncbi:MAG TPA: diguanylate cyclase [Denitromonas sp.]|uniref:diguanylate cyclase n=1 Tax=Denitromonas sp. TaxID=2734609 RepID=UPI001DA1208B|nr:diguanylate cyclase [Rhodocyclaceae bacterium]MCP5220761.1 diguanylate cyclase [Zoogloeaceae bacterium]HQU88141.1 diguanylate cyclase [Denitromonas sp.]HQV14518.1 diguanylate cyclase [Denitromonas sp.]
MIESQWIRQPVLALVYALAGVLASMFPGPVAGEVTIAIPAVVALLGWLACGPWALIGVSFGAFFFGMISDPLLASLPRPDVFTGALIGVIGANLQALLGATLTRRFVPGWKRLTHVFDALRLFLFAGVVAALPWAALRLLLRNWGDFPLFVSPAAAFAAAWLSQVIAVVALLPVLLTVCWYRDPLWRTRLSSLVVPAGAVLLAALALYRVAFDVEQERHAARFEAVGAAISHRFEDRLGGVMAALDGVDRLFESDAIPTRRAFHRLVEASLQRAPGLVAVQWVPQVAGRERSTYEALAGADGLEGFVFRDLGGGGGLSPAKTRDLHYPVFFSVPRQVSPYRLGVDLASSPDAMQAITHTLETGVRTVSPIFRSMSGAQARSAGTSLALLSPVYRDPGGTGGAGLGGLTLGVLRLAPLMASVVADFDLAGLFVSLADASDGESHARLYPSTETVSGVRFAMTETFPVGDRIWQLRMVSDAAFEATGGVPLLWISMVGSAVLFALLHGFLLTVSGQRVEVARQIDEATARLTREIEERRRVEATLRQSDARMSGVFQAVVDGIVIIDELGTIDSVNPAITGIFGWAPEDLVGRNVSMLMPEPFQSEHDGYLEAYRRTGRKRTIGFHRSVEGLKKNGSRFPVELTVSELVLADRKVFVGLLRDITDRVASAEQARQFNEQLQDMVGALERRDGELTELNRINEQLMACNDRNEAAEVVRLAMARIFAGTSGRIVAHVPGQRDGHLSEWVTWGNAPGLASLVHPNECWAVRQGRSYEVVAAEALVKCTHVDPGIGPYICIPLMMQGRAHALVTLAYGTASEVQRRNVRRLLGAVAESVNLALSNLNLREILRDQVVRDPLTQLYNRRYMEEALSHEVQRARRNGSLLGCTVIDLDHFKAINDAYGHDVGDEVLRRMAEALNRWFRSSDTVCRYGGEEFVVIMPEQSGDAISERLRSLQAHFADEVFHAGSRRFTRCTFSAGVAVASGVDIDSIALLKQADNALYAAKAAGRNRVVLEGG